MTRRAALPLIALALLLAACASPAGAPEATSAIRATVEATANAAASPSPAPTATATAAPIGASITVDFVGDISLARQLVDRMQAGGAGYPYALIAPLMDADIGFANLEGPLTERGTPWAKAYNFRTPPRFASGLLPAGFGVVTLANNHTMDYGAVGLTDTIDALDAAGVRHAGAGANALNARFPAIIEKKGLRVAFLAYVATPDEGGGFSIGTWEANAGKPGVALGTAAVIASDVAAVRRVADFVIVAVHAGDEYRNAPNATQRALAQAAMDAGADAYIGAHAHVVQPVEQRGRQLVAWGLGNFIFDLDEVDLANIPQPRVSLILKVTLTKGTGVTAFQAIPVTLDAEQDRPRPATPAEAADLQRLIAP